MNLQKNLFGGMTAAIIALPLGLAFGVASGLGATAGIYGAIVLGFFASLFGGTPTQISGPTGPMTVVMASAVISLNGDLGMIVTAILIAGLFQIVFGLSKIGKFVRYIPYPVISGFMSGIGIIIIILQINPYLGLPSDASVVHILTTLYINIPNINFNAIVIATLTLMIMFLTPQQIAKIIPSPLIALLLITPLSVYFNLDLETIGEIPSALPSFIIPSISLENYSVIVTLGFTLAVLGTIDTLLTSIVADSITGTKHKPNKELIGQGIGNSLCALIGAIPGAGATMRTVVNIKSGGTHKISGMIHSIILLIIVLFLAPLAAQIPMALLAGILIKVGIDILDYRFISVWKHSPGHDLSVMLIVFFITVFFDLITAVGVGIVLSSLLIVYKVTKDTKIGDYKKNENFVDSHHNLVEKGIRVIKMDGAFFFGSSTTFEKEAITILDTQTIIIDIVDVPFMDITAMFTILDIIERLQKEKITIGIVIKKKDKQQLTKLDKKELLNKVNFYHSIEDALKNN